MRSWIRTLGLFALLVIGLSAAGCSGCSENNDGIQQGSSGQLSVSPLNVTFRRIPIGETTTERVTIRNISTNQPLQIFEVSMQAREGGTAADLELVDLPSGEFTVEPGQTRSFEVEFTANGRANAAVIDIVSSDARYSLDNPYTLNVDTLANTPRLVADPDPVRFPRLPPGERTDRDLVIRNEGTAPLVIHDVSYTGGSDFSIESPTDEEIVLDPYDSTLADDNPERFELVVPVTYAPRGDGGDSGEILIESNDTSDEELESGRGLTVVDVRANAQAPCILVDGTTRRFGQVPIGGNMVDVVTVTNCGSETLEISSIEISQNSDDDEFALELGAWDVNGDDQLDDPVRISPGASDTFQINYGPTQVGSDSGAVLILSNDPTQDDLELQLVGRGSDGQCPEAKANGSVRGAGVAPRPTVSTAPLEYIVLDGTTSVDPDGRVVDWEWEVLEQPDGINTRLTELNDDGSKVEFRALTAGTYKLGLNVQDNEGFWSCNQAVVTVVATPNEAIHVELTWTNPEDPDESDDSGSDVDVHLVKMGPGEWFQAPYDIYFRNPNSGAGGASGIWNPESPSLDIDDTDGGGPENIQMDDPANCEWYAVGVHYYRQLFGTAYATVRIYINENLVYEQINKPLQSGGQFWDVARIHWNQGQATILDVNEVMPVAPIEQMPVVTGDMSASGLCTSASLY